MSKRKSVSKFISKEMSRNLVKITLVTSRYSTYLKQSHGRNLISGGFLRRLNACEHLRRLFGTRHEVKVNLAASFLPRGERESSLEILENIFTAGCSKDRQPSLLFSVGCGYTADLSRRGRLDQRDVSPRAAHPPFFPRINYTIPIKSIKLISIEKPTGSLFSVGETILER